jgi:hypothetical protein
MGAGASVNDFEESFYHYSDSTTKPRIIISLDFDLRTIFCKRAIPVESYHALSHRWQNRSNDTTWHVSVEHEGTYDCQLTNNEAENIKFYLTQYGPGLWLDYVCIDQSSSGDKNAQVHHIFFFFMN